MKKKKIYKLNVLGNDFLITKNNEKKNKTLIKNIKKICNRNYGLGVDGIIIYKKKINKLLIRIFNSDKTEANNCINGIKALLGIIKKNINKIETLTNNITLLKNKKIIKLKLKNSNKYRLFNKITNILINNKKKKQIKNFLYLGNKHLIIEDYKKKKNKKNNKINISKYKIINKKISIKTREAGAGKTNSCGTANISLTIILLKNNIIKNKKKIHINNKYGKIKIFSTYQNKKTIIIKTAIKKKKILEGYFK